MVIKHSHAADVFHVASCLLNNTVLLSVETCVNGCTDDVTNVIGYRHIL